MALMASFKKSMNFSKGAKAYKNSQYAQALGYFMLALKHTGDNHEIARIKEVIADTYLAMGRKDKANHYANTSLQLYRQLYDKNKSQALSKAINRVTQFLAAIK